ncbi:MAG: elongation factor P [Negativicutes bacterium]|nr:elongation factor P [Negativicutes bacterium]
MISTNDFKTGITVEIDNAVWQVIDFQHVKPGKGAAFVRAKIRNLVTGAVVERTFNAGEKLSRGHVEKRKMQYLYAEGQSYTFMDNETYEQTELSAGQLGDAVKYLKENMDIDVLFFRDAVIGVELPTSVVLKVIETDPGIKGDTATGGSKPATLETGHTVKVPLFIEAGDLLRVDTRSGEYIERA